jgi:NADH:ubiquinone oxidoreductase subunit 5 (subunit L)/multisubunit Na+/H+ antiporter MnhA subunit
MSEWITFNGALQSGVEHGETIRVVVFSLGLVATLLTAGYILWMYKRVFFGKIPERLVHVKDSNRYITATMAFLAAMTLIVGVYPDMFLVPITGYITNMFSSIPEVLPLPTAEGGGGSSGSGDVEVTNVTSTTTTTTTTSILPIRDVNVSNGDAQLHNVLNEGSNQANMAQLSILYYYHPNIAGKVGVGASAGTERGGGGSA